MLQKHTRLDLVVASTPGFENVDKKRELDVNLESLMEPSGSPPKREKVAVSLSRIRSCMITIHTSTSSYRCYRVGQLSV